MEIRKSYAKINEYSKVVYKDKWKFECMIPR